MISLTHMLLTKKKLNFPETNSSPLKMDGWKLEAFPFGSKGLFSGANLLLVLGSVKCKVGHKVTSPIWDWMGLKMGRKEYLSIHESHISLSQIINIS